MARKKYNAVDLVKFIMSLSVIAYHTWPYLGLENRLARGIYYSTAAIALPFFFISSGFLLAQSLDDDFSSERNYAIIKKTVLRYLKMYLIWTLVYLPITIYNYVDTGRSFGSAVLSFIKGTVLKGSNYNSWQLWYLLSSVYALLVILLCMKWMKGRFDRKRLLALGAVGLALMLFFEFLFEMKDSSNAALSMMGKLVDATIGNGQMFMGLLYIPVGIYLQKHPISKSAATIAFAAGFIAEIFLDNLMLQYISEAVKGVGIFQLLLYAELPDAKIFSYFRKLSNTNYFLHMIFYSLYCKIVYDGKVHTWDSFVVTAAVTMIAGLIYIEVQKRSKKKLPAK